MTKMRKLRNRYVGKYQVTTLDLGDKMAMASVVRDWGNPLHPNLRSQDGQLPFVSVTRLTGLVMRTADQIGLHYLQVIRASRRRHNAQEGT